MTKHSQRLVGTMKQLISVIMCTYNEGQKELAQAIQSILSQTYTCFELLIVLDNPENQLIRELVFSYAQKDHRIRVVENKRNMGVAKSTNRAWKMAKGKYIAKMDADDIASPQRLERELEVLLERKLDFVAASKRNIDEQGNQLGFFVNSLNPDQVRLLLPYDNLVNQSTVLMKKSVLKELNGYTNLPSCEDYDLWLRMMCSGYRMAILPDIFVDYRVRQNSITRTDHYKQYLSDCFVRRMCHAYRRSHKLWTIDDFRQYIKKRRPDLQKKRRFNHCYGLYYKGMEARKVGRYRDFICYVLTGTLQEPRVMALLIRKLMFHIRKKIVLGASCL